MISSIGKSGARSSGPIGSIVPGWRYGGAGLGRSGWMLYQRFGSADSLSKYLVVSMMREHNGCKRGQGAVDRERMRAGSYQARKSVVDLRFDRSALEEMALRPRLARATLVLGAVRVFSLLGIVSSGASVRARGKVVSASLTSTSFPAAQAKTVKLAYRISPKSKHFAYLLSLKQGAKWAKVRSVSKTGGFKGSRKMIVKALFGSKSVSVGQYRVKLFADANSLSRQF